jgi:hypothetical protein
MIALAHPANPLEVLTDLDTEPSRRQLAVRMEDQLVDEGVEPATLEELEAAQLLERWERPDGRAWTLTPYAARCLKVEIRERLELTGDEAAEVEYWDYAAKPRRSPRMPLPRFMARIPFPDRLIDPSPGPGFMVDEVSDEPVKLFAGGGGGGILVEIDRRLKGKR